MKKLILFLSLACMISCEPVIAQSYCIAVSDVSVIADSVHCSVDLAWTTTGCNRIVIHYDGKPVSYAGDTLLDAAATAWESPIPAVSGVHFIQFDGYDNAFNKVSSPVFIRSYTVNCLSSKKKKK